MAGQDFRCFAAAQHDKRSGVAHALRHPERSEGSKVVVGYVRRGVWRLRGGRSTTTPLRYGRAGFQMLRYRSAYKGSCVVAGQRSLIQPPLHFQVINFFKVGILSCYN
jgi:hypothetical protein